MTLVISLGDEVPQSVRDKAKAVADAGGMTALKKLMDELPELLTRNTEILDECERMLKEERESDEQLKSQHKDKWNRTPSGQLTGTFNTNATKYRTIINNAKAVRGYKFGHFFLTLQEVILAFLRTLGQCLLAMRLCLTRIICN